MISFKINNIDTNTYISNFNRQIKSVNDSVLTLEEAVKLLEKECLDEMQDKCKIVIDLEKEGKIYENKLKRDIEDIQELGPNEKRYIEISSIIGDIGQKAKETSESLISLKYEQSLNKSSKDLVKLVETNESITRKIYITVKHLEETNNEKINKFSKKILYNKKEVERLANYILDKYAKEFQLEDSSETFKNMVVALKKIPEDAEKIILMITKEC